VLAAWGLATLATGGLAALPLLGAAAGMAGTVGAVGVASGASDTTLNEQAKEFVEAAFLFHLEQRGHAVMGADNQLYIDFSD
jgi:hypothetical protein